MNRWIDHWKQKVLKYIISPYFLVHCPQWSCLMAAFTTLCGSSDSFSISNICLVNYSACYNYNCSHFSWFFYQFNTWACGSWQYCLLILFSFLLLGSTLSTDTYQTVILLSDLEMLCACLCLALEKGYDVHPAYWACLFQKCHS